MLRWCSYCQQFLGELAPYDHLAVTHGICAACNPVALDFRNANLTFARSLKSIQDQLYEAGLQNDLQAAERIIEGAGQVHLRAVDIMIGIIAPLLYQIGEDWKRGAISVAEEHRFTAFCEKTFELAASKVAADLPQDDGSGQEGVEVLLLNAPGNRHTLAVRILALWLLGRGIRARALDRLSDAEAVVQEIVSLRPRLVLISMALAEQAGSVVGIVDRIAALPGEARPTVFVGGYAVKQGLVSEIPGAELLADINRIPQAATDQRTRQQGG